MKQPKPLEWEFEPMSWSKEGIEQKERLKKQTICNHGIPKAQCHECQVVCVGCG